MKINRQLNTSINLYLRMRGLPPSMKVWLKMIKPILRRSRVTLKGCETDDILPINPEEVEADAHQDVRELSKAHIH